MPLRIETVDGGVTFWVKVVPGSSRDRIVGLLGDSLKVAVSKPAQKGAANEAVIELLSDAFRISKKQIIILKGHTNPRKQVQIKGIAVNQLRSLIDES
ncbi:MAG TPA: DUF167 domain-containing protein [Tepidisphaeraceae bacterium]|nr:DUF167 domain-containing protein [Tepidisphaeraceae bacterium]